MGEQKGPGFWSPIWGNQSNFHHLIGEVSSSPPASIFLSAINMCIISLLTKHFHAPFDPLNNRTKQMLPHFKDKEMGFEN